MSSLRKRFNEIFPKKVKEQFVVKQVRGKTCRELFQSLNHIRGSPPTNQAVKVALFNTDVKEITLQIHTPGQDASCKTSLYST